MKKLTRLKCLSSLILALAAALSLTACSADTASGVFPELSQIVGEIIQTAEESSPVTREFFQTQEPEEQSAEPERPDVPQTPGEGQVGFPQTDEESVQPDAPPESSPVTREFFQTQEPEKQSAEPERPDVPLTSGEGQEGFPQTDEESVQPDAPTESSPVTREFFQTQEPEEQSAEPERPDVPQTPGEGQVGFPQTDEESVQPDAPPESSPVTREFFQTQEPEKQSAEPERPDVPLTSGEGQEGFPQTDEESVQPDAPTESSIAEDGSYTTKEDVALYIHTYGKLPQNFITKKQARELGWGGGSLEPYAPGMCIGGDRFGNYEGLLPEGHSYTECDVNTLGASSRGAERIIFSSDGLIYYTGDHYASFTLLYGEE